MTEGLGAEFPGRRNLRIWVAGKVVSLVLQGYRTVWIKTRMGVSDRGTFVSIFEGKQNTDPVQNL